jgi:hypothetical protein
MLWPLQVPAELPVELQVSPLGQPLPPLPWHPVWHVLVLTLQIRPDVAPPQSVSTAHPHISLARQAEPTPVALQFWFMAVVHPTHRLDIGSQTCPPAQSGSFRHCTQTWGCTIVLHTPLGAVQAVLLLQSCAMHMPTEPFVCVQYSPVAQLVTPAVCVLPSAPPSTALASTALASTTPASAVATTRHPVVQVPVLTVEV